MTIIPELEQQLFRAAEELLPAVSERDVPVTVARAKRSGLSISRWRHPSRWAAAGLAALAVGGSVAAAAATVHLLSAETGIRVRAGSPNASAIGTGQAIAMGAASDVSFGLKLTRDIHFAPGYRYWKAGTIAFQTSLGGGAPLGHAYMTSSALRHQVAESAACSWLTYYVASAASHNTGAMARAAAQVRAAPHWPAIIRFGSASDLASAVRAVDAGDAKLVNALIATGQVGNCTALGPYPPAGLSATVGRASLAAANRAGQREIAIDPLARRLGIPGGRAPEAHR